MEGLPRWLRGKGSTCNAEDSGDTSSVPGSGRRHSNPLQYSCLENPTDRGACWATVQRVTKESDRSDRACMEYHHKKKKKNLKSRWKPSGKASILLIKCCRCNCPIPASKVTLVVVTRAATKSFIAKHALPHPCPLNQKEQQPISEPLLP